MKLQTVFESSLLLCFGLAWLGLLGVAALGTLTARGPWRV